MCFPSLSKLVGYYSLVYLTDDLCLENPLPPRLTEGRQLMRAIASYKDTRSDFALQFDQ
eukprot:Awhi_evm1s1718